MHVQLKEFRKIICLMFKQLDENIEITLQNDCLLILSIFNSVIILFIIPLDLNKGHHF